MELADSKDASSSEKFLLADVWVAKVKEVGISDQQIHTKTHLGHLLNPGDTALGLDPLVMVPHFSLYTLYL